MTDDDADAEFRAKYRYVKIGYVAAGAQVALALVCFIMSIGSGVGAVAGIGGIFMFGSLVAVIITAIYHNLSGVFDEQTRRSRF